MSTKDISTLETIDEWEAAITKAFQRATREAVLENARLGLSPMMAATDLLGPALREAGDVYRTPAPEIAEKESDKEKTDE